MIVPPTFSVFRLPSHMFEEDELASECCRLFKDTVYVRGALREMAPRVADCLTSIYHLFKTLRSYILEIDYIGNMPRRCKQMGWIYGSFEQEKITPGDLIFLRKRSSSRLITHVGVAINSKTVFHCSFEKRGGSFEKIADLFKHYTQPSIEQMLAYRDKRGSVPTLSIKNC